MTPKIIAHRGVTRNDQENTLPAYNQAFSEGADGLEIDVRLSKDEKRKLQAQAKKLGIPYKQYVKGIKARLRKKRRLAKRGK